MKPAGNPHGAVQWRLVDGYHATPGMYDEMMDAPESLRRHWEPFIHSIETLSRHELASRWDHAKRAIRDNGVSYNVYGDAQSGGRQWGLDLLPLVVAGDEWRHLEAGLVQRTRLLNLILGDLYGPQRLLRERALPPALVFANPAFLRPCHGIRVPRDIHLHLHAVDVARSPDGHWWALADHGQAPTGAGYALENRMVLSRALAEALRDCRVQRLGPFFRAQRETLAALAPAARDQPNVVLLTSGPYHATYFEQAYLARYLGFTLVERGDLTVRDSRVFIKTLDGLEEVDVIFRRVDDSSCDPLELRGDSSVGVAGLVEAARAGNVVIANALGSGLIETAALMAFLPDLCRRVLGEELRLPSVATWWCGDPNGLQYVLEHLDELVIRRAFPSGSTDPIVGRQLTSEQHSALAAEMRDRPTDFVALEHPPLSTAPVWLGHKLEPRAAILRTYVAAAGDSYHVMPGGLTRVASASDVPIVSMRRGGGSKDTWVLADGAVATPSPLASGSVVIRHERRASDVASRVADHLFWLGRHAERTEHTMRLLRSVVAYLTDEDTTEETPELVALLHVLVDLDLLPARVRAHMPLGDLEQELLTFVFKPSTHGGLRRMLNELRRMATVVRDRLSEDTWRILNQLQQDFRNGRLQSDAALEHLNRMITDLAAFSGMEMENMTRGHGWRFLDVGRRLERSINLLSLLRSALVTGQAERGMLEPLLAIADSSMTYRRRYYAGPQLRLVLDLLLADPTNARGLAFQLGALSEHVGQLPRDPRAPSPTKEESLVARAIATLRQTDIETLCELEHEGLVTGAVALLDSIEDDLRALSDAITYYYFSHAELRVNWARQ